MTVPLTSLVTSTNILLMCAKKRRLLDPEIRRITSICCREYLLVNTKSLHCDIQKDFVSSVLLLLANISYRLGRDLELNGAEEKFINDSEGRRITFQELP